MNRKPDTLVMLIFLVAVGALLTGFVTPEMVQANVGLSESLIR
jgi:hypothetical protein